jgi:hypothetical protein
MNAWAAPRIPGTLSQLFTRHTKAEDIEQALL